MRRTRGLAALVGLLLLLAGPIAAYESYHDPALIDDGYCASCHPGFGGGRSDTLHALHTGGPTPVTTNCNLCHTSAGRDNPLTMWSAGSANDGLGCAGCHGRDYGETVGADHRGFPTAGRPKASGYGLRKHHIQKGVTVCLDCHTDVAQSAILGEDVDPPYYARSDVSMLGLPMSACDNEDSLNDPDTLGLDNDGDLVYDTADGDCVVTVPDINLVPASLAFGTLSVGSSLLLTATIQNLGTGDLTVTAVGLCGGTSPEYSWAPPAPFTVPAGGSQLLNVTYAPVDAGIDAGCLSLSSDDPDEPTVLLNLSGSGTSSAQPNITLSPASLDFGDVVLGGSSTLTAQVQNTGTADLVVSSIAPCAATSPEYVWTPLAATTIPPGGSEPLAVTYTPSVEGIDSGCLELSTNDPDSPLLSVPLSAGGVNVPSPLVLLDPVSIDFGSQVAGTSTTLGARVINGGNADLVISGISLCAGTSGEFSWTPFVSTTIPAATSQTLFVTWAPVDAGVDSGCLELVTNDPASPTITLGLTGDATILSQPRIVLDPPSLEYGSVLMRSSRKMTCTIRNEGTAQLIVWNIMLCSSGSREFRWRPGAPFAISAGASEAVKVTYLPTDVGPDIGCLQITSNDPDQTDVFLNLSGTGVTSRIPDISVEPRSLDFGALLLGGSATRSARIRNIGTAALNLSGVALCAGTTSELRLIPPASTTILPGATETVSVVYTPLTLGADTGCLEIASDDPGEPSIVLDIAGNATDRDEPDVVVEPLALDFADVPFESTGVLTARIRNVGTRDLALATVARCDATSSEFGWLPLSRPSLAPGGAEDLVATFTPVDLGPDVGCLQIVTDDPDSPIVALDVMASAVPIPGPNITLETDAVDFGDVPVGTTATAAVRITNTGLENLVVSRFTRCVGTGGELSVEPLADSTIPSTGIETLAVTFSPEVDGAFSGCLEIWSNDPDVPVATLQISGNALPLPGPNVNLVPGSLDFATVRIGSTRSASVEVRNTGDADLVLSSISACAGTSGEFSGGVPPAAPIPPGGSDVVSVAYAPADEGIDSGCLQIATNDPDAPVATVAVTGIGAAIVQPDIELELAALDFGSVLVRGSRQMRCQIRNVGTSQLIVWNVGLCSTGSRDFRWRPSAPFAIEPGAFKTLTVTYGPTAAELDEGCIDITTNDPDEIDVTLALGGTGTFSRFPDIEIAPAVDFGPVDIGAVAEIPVNVRNKGTANLNLGAISACPGSSAELAWVAPSNTVLRPGSSEVLALRYAPADLGADAGCVTVTSDDPDTPSVTVDLFGSGQIGVAPDVAFQPAALDFGLLAVGDAATLTTQIVNTGNAELVIDGFASCLGTSRELTWIAPAAATVPAGGSETLTVIYTPTGAGSDIGCLELFSNDPDTPALALTLSGAAEAPPAPDVAVTPAALDFAAVSAAGSSTRTAVLLNVGTLDLRVAGVTLCAGTSSEFTWSPIAGAVVPPGGSLSLDVTYSPADAGADSGCLELATDDPDSPVVALSVSGTGEVPPAPRISIQPAALSFGTVLMGASSSLGALVRNSGSAPLVVSGVAPCGGTSGEFSWAPLAAATIPPGGAQSLVVSYTPIDAGLDSGCLSILSNDPVAPAASLSLSGAGESPAPKEPDIAVSPISLDFGVLMAGEVSVLATFVRNNGQADLTISSIALCGGTSPEFSWAPLASTTIPPGGFQILQVTYAPADAGADGGCLTIASDDPDTPSVLVSLQGQTHPQAVTDCANCHLDRTTGVLDLPGIHGNQCSTCHPVDFSSTVIGPIGTFTGQCGDCHNPAVAATGNRATPTKGHRCVLCHGEQRSTADFTGFHHAHLERANCVVCHGFIPDVGVEIGSGRRDVCNLCHSDNRQAWTDVQTIHKKHVPKGLSCLECHADQRPPIDVVAGPPVGNASVICDVCHSGKSPSEFRSDSQGLHKKHVGKSLDCGACHAGAQLQDDRAPMAASIDDPVRASLDRSGTNECSHCHDRVKSYDPETVHQKHVNKQNQWCHNCHEATDGRPAGLVPPVQEPSEACRMCHGGRTFKDPYPFDLHQRHSGLNGKAKIKCYACHQLTPQFTGWPSLWLDPAVGGGAAVVRAGGAGGGVLPGDANRDARVDMSDSLSLLGHLFRGQPAQLPCGDGSLTDPGNVRLLDSNGDGRVDLSDAVYLLEYAYGGGPPPVLGSTCVPVSDCGSTCSE